VRLGVSEAGGTDPFDDGGAHRICDERAESRVELGGAAPNEDGAGGVTDDKGVHGAPGAYGSRVAKSIPHSVSARGWGGSSFVGKFAAPICTVVRIQRLVGPEVNLDPSSAS
jgi:hypothetical protein